MEDAMNKREESKLAAYGEIVDVINLPGDGIEIPMGIVNAKSNLKLICDEIKVKEEQLKNAAVGKTYAKDKALNEIIEQAVIIAGSIYAFAVAGNNDELEQFAEVNDKTLYNTRETDIPIKAKAVLDKADELGTALEIYGTTQAERDKLRNALADFADKDTIQNTGLGNKTAARDDLTSLFVRADKVVKVIEKLMKKFEQTNPEYYNRFTAANNIKNKAVRHRDNGEEEEQNPPEETPPQNP